MEREIRRVKRNWGDEIAKEAEETANKQHMKTLYNLTQTLCNEKPREGTAVNDRNGNVLTSIKDRRKRWREHFMGIVNVSKVSKVKSLFKAGDSNSSANKLEAFH